MASTRPTTVPGNMEKAKEKTAQASMVDVSRAASGATGAQHPTQHLGKPVWDLSSALWGSLRRSSSHHHAVIDCGASKSIIGGHTLQRVCVTTTLVRDWTQELCSDRSVTRSFLIATITNACSQSFGLAQLNRRTRRH